MSGYEVALRLYEKEVGPKPEKVHHLVSSFFLNTCSYKIWKRGIEKIIKEVLTSFSIVVHCSAHYC